MISSYLAPSIKRWLGEGDWSLTRSTRSYRIDLPRRYLAKPKFTHYTITLKQSSGNAIPAIWAFQAFNHFPATTKRHSYNLAADKIRRAGECLLNGNPALHRAAAFRAWRFIWGVLWIIRHCWCLVHVRCRSLPAVALIPLASQGHCISGPCQCRYFYP